MKLAVSNIAWDAADDIQMYRLMEKYEFTGLEIAPTRIFPKSPYDKLTEAEVWSQELRETYGLIVPSMQSIWYGRQEKLFGILKERQVLIDYTKKAIDFAETIGCGNLVFGCPRNREVPKGVDSDSAVSFFREIGDYAAEHKTVIAMEANPPIYNTNYINDTASALELVENVNSKGFLLNLDVGTMIQNEEKTEELSGKIHLIHHVHISEPGLKPVEKRSLHKTLRQLLEAENYDGFVSIEMGKTGDLMNIERVMQYVMGVFR